MAKDPAFLFYPGDWNLGTMHLTLLEKGCYMELLILQFAKGKFTEAQAKHMLNGSFDLAWATISEKFETDGKFYWNKRLQIEKEKRQKFTDSRRNNGSVKKIEKKTSTHMLKHMEDENDNKNNKQEIGIVSVKNIANEVWKDVAWMESLCMSNGMNMAGAKDWMQQFNLSISQDNIDNFDARRYKKMFQGWLRVKLGGGQKVTKVSSQENETKEMLKKHGL